MTTPRAKRLEKQVTGSRYSSSSSSAINTFSPSPLYSLSKSSSLSVPELSSVEEASINTFRRFVDSLALECFLSLWFGRREAPIAHNWMAGVGSNSSSGGPSIQILMKLLRVFSVCDARKSVFTRFISENILSTFALEMGMERRRSTNSSTMFHLSLRLESKILFKHEGSAFWKDRGTVWCMPLGHATAPVNC